MIIRVKVVPKSKISEVVGRVGTTIRVKVKAPDYEQQANEELRRVLAEFFDVRFSDVRILRGQRGREKMIEIEGRKEEDLRYTLETIP